MCRAFSLSVRALKCFLISVKFGAVYKLCYFYGCFAIKIQAFCAYTPISTFSICFSFVLFIIACEFFGGILRT
ncbi:hypothetical protein [Campylobacter sp.]|uniref:hypothetical protein n=1 Tax=Campylobacter sp. TaxID=205 RepID=UPI002AA8C190|nr:hypothetical protein [Campylobacter sp.]